MVALILFLILVAILFGAGAAIHALWWVAIIALAIWVLGFVLRPHGGGGRWYYW
jgi:steroid 5-alpha reductase family enzyme